MEKKIYKYLRFRPSDKPYKRLISELVKYPLDYIFTPTASQEELYTKFKHISDDLIANTNSCIIAVGSPNSGRKYSLFGRHPAHYGIVTRIIEDILQYDAKGQFILYFSINDLNGKPYLKPGDSTQSKLQIKFESNLIDIIQQLKNSSSIQDSLVYKLTLAKKDASKQSELTIIQLESTQENIDALTDYLNGTSNPSKVFSALSSTKQLPKVSVLLTCKEEKKELDKIKQVFIPNSANESAPNGVIDNLDDVQSLKNKIIDLENQLKAVKEKYLDAEKRAHEYYECYHKTLLLINKDSAQNVFLNSQNEGLIRQIRKETSILQSLETKYQALFDTCTKSHESTYIEFDSCFDSMLKSDTSEELNVTDTLNLGITQVKLALTPDPALYSTYSAEIKQALEGNSELNKEIQILQLKNQLIEASVINANLSRTLSTYDWKLAMIKYRYDMKRLVSKQQQEKIKSLEELLEYLHNSFENIKKNTIGHNNQIEKLFEKYCYRAINDSQLLVSEYKRAMQNTELKVSECYKKDARNWMNLIQEHKKNYEKELIRKQDEVIRLNELLGKWINKYMELQESITASDKPLSIVHYNQIQNIIHETINSPAAKIQTSQMTPKGKPTNLIKFGVLSGDIQPPL